MFGGFLKNAIEYFLQTLLGADGKVKRCIPRRHFQLVISRHKKSQKIFELWPTGISYWWAISRLKKSQKISEFWPTGISYWWAISRLKKSQKISEFWPTGINYWWDIKMKRCISRDIFNWLLAGIKSRRKYPNFGLQGSVIDWHWGWKDAFLRERAQGWTTSLPSRCKGSSTRL